MFACFGCASRPSVQYEPADARGESKAGSVPSDDDGIKPGSAAICAGYGKHQVTCHMMTPSSSEPDSSSDGQAASSHNQDGSDAASDFHDCLSRCSLQSWASLGDPAEEEPAAACVKMVVDTSVLDTGAARDRTPSSSGSGSGSQLSLASASPLVHVGILNEPKATLPHWVPSEPLMFNTDPSIQFLPIPVEVPYAGYWAKDESRSTPGPWPSDVLLGGGRFCHNVKSSLQGIKFTDQPDILKIQLRATVLGMGFTYTEIFLKDNSVSTWNLRRDVSVGVSKGQCFYTAAGVFVARVWCTGGGVPAYYEDYVECLPDGSMRIVQHCKNMRTGKTTVQHLVGWSAPLPVRK